MHMLSNYVMLLWGWPDQSLQRMDRVNTLFVLVNGKGGFSTGCIWTNRIDKIIPYFIEK